MTHLQFHWAEHGPRRRRTPEDAPGATPSLTDPPHGLATPFTPAATNDAEKPTTLPAASEALGPPLFPPLATAIEGGVFGITEAGPIEPDEEDVASLTLEHANEMIALLADRSAVEAGLRTGCDPRTGKLPRTPESRSRLEQRLQTERVRLQEAYADALAVYAEAFGDDAATALDAWVRAATPNTV